MVPELKMQGKPIGGAGEQRGDAGARGPNPGGRACTSPLGSFRTGGAAGKELGGWSPAPALTLRLHALTPMVFYRPIKIAFSK